MARARARARARRGRGRRRFRVDEREDDNRALVTFEVAEGARAHIGRAARVHRAHLAAEGEELSGVGGEECDAGGRHALPYEVRGEVCCEPGLVRVASGAAARLDGLGLGVTDHEEVAFDARDARQRARARVIGDGGMERGDGGRAAGACGAAWAVPHAPRRTRVASPTVLWRAFRRHPHAATAVEGSRRRATDARRSGRGRRRETSRPARPPPPPQPPVPRWPTRARRSWRVPRPSRRRPWRSRGSVAARAAPASACRGTRARTHRTARRDLRRRTRACRAATAIAASAQPHRAASRRDPEHRASLCLANIIRPRDAGLPPPSVSPSSSPSPPCLALVFFLQRHAVALFATAA